MASSPNNNNNTASLRPAAGRPQASHPSPYPVVYQQQQLYLPPRSQTQNGILYPVASSGRGFMPGTLRPSDNTTPLRGTYRAPLLSHPHYPSAPLPLPLHHHHHYPAPSPPAPPIKGIPLPSQLMVAPSPSPSPVSDSNGYKNMRDLPDDAVVVIRDRKVRLRVSGSASLYALCRSWLRNGVAEETQTPYSEVVKTLPRPLPLPVVDSNSPTKEVEGEDADEAEETVEHLSAQDLLKRHVKHAKKVRARLREERLSRIARYKTRLALLLPPQAEQLRNDTAAGN